eukprot:Platyproteum_vivax@DN12018_c0_g1_i1.p1
MSLISADDNQADGAKKHKHATAEEHSSRLRRRIFRKECCRIPLWMKKKLWAPLITPLFVLCVYYIIGTCFLILGALIYTTSKNSLDCVKAYPSVDDGGSAIETVYIDSSDCNVPRTVITPPLFFYYQLSNFFQNHRQYVNSVSERQLAGVDISSETVMEECDPITKDALNRVYFPCGIAARSVFDDTYVLSDSRGFILKMDSSVEAIAWPEDKSRYRHRNDLDPDSVHDWLDRHVFPLGVETSHFIVWMRISPLPIFRKLWGKITGPSEIHLPIRIDVVNRFNTTSWEGKKAVAMAAPTWLGGRNLWLGVSFLVVGSLLLLAGFGVTVFYIVQTRAQKRALTAMTLSRPGGRLPAPPVVLKWSQPHDD